MEEEKQAREQAAEEAVRSKKLPAGTCKATNPANPIPNPNPNNSPSPSPNPNNDLNPHQATNPELKARGDAKAQQH